MVDSLHDLVCKLPLWELILSNMLCPFVSLPGFIHEQGEKPMDREQVIKMLRDTLDRLHCRQVDLHNTAPRKITITTNRGGEVIVRYDYFPTIEIFD